MKSKFFIRIITLALCPALLIGCLAFSGVSAAAAEGDPPQSAWEMTVPQVRVTTENGNGTTLQKEDGYQAASVTITDVDGATLSDSCSFKVRGNTTALSWIEKKAFTFKFAKKKDVLGMGKGKKWALIANAFDPTLLRNYTAFSLAHELGLAYTSEFRVVELWVDDVYRGCYLLTEPVQEGKERVNIDIESNGGMQDFLMEYERQREEDDVTYFTVDGMRFIASEPEEPTEEQLAYIQGKVQDVITTIRTGTREQIEEKVDIESFAKYFVLNEFCKTFDFDTSSVYFYYKDGKLYAGPPWDYDLSLGNANPDYGTRGKNAYEPEDPFAQNKNIYRFLCQNAWFYDEVRAVLREHSDFIADIGADGGLADRAAAQYADVIARNYQDAGWRVSKWWINIQLKPQATYEANLDYLKSWCVQRSAWMDACYHPFRETFPVGDADGDGRLTIGDATYIQRVLAEQLVPENEERFLLRADITGDGLSIDDVTLVLRYLAEFGDDNPIGETRDYDPA